MKILFLHGWHSVPGGVKPSYLIEHGHEVVNPALDDDFDGAVRTAQAEFDIREEHGMIRCATVLVASLTVGLPVFAQDKKGPLAELPSKPGAHVEKIKAMGDNEWLNLGAPPPTRSGARHGAVRGALKP